MATATVPVDVTRETVRLARLEIAKVGPFSVRLSWLCPFVGVFMPNWTDEEREAAEELDAYHAETLEAARAMADRSEWVFRLKYAVRHQNGLVEFEYEPAYPAVEVTRDAA